MSLQFTGAVIYDDTRDCVLAHALDDERGIRCAITREALMDLSRVPEATAQQLIAIYLGNSTLVNAIARKKYKAGPVEDGWLLVTTQDLNGPLGTVKAIPEPR